MTDEDIFQQARLMVIAHLQKITFNDWLPVILGQSLPAYTGYDNTQIPDIAEFFSTSAFRFGHDMLTNVILRLDPLGNTIPDGSVLLRDIFFDIVSFNSTGASPYLRGASVSPNRIVDTVLEDDVRIFLYGTGPATAFDLSARNMQRARDIGMGFYNDARTAYNLTTCQTFDCVTNDTTIISLLNQLYGTNNVSFLDTFVGGLLEAKANSKSKLGPLFSQALIDQFTRIRNGDRFYYQNPGVLSAAQLAEIQATTLSDIILRNTDSKIMPGDVFNRQALAPEQVFNPVNNTGWIVAIVVLTVVASILIIVVVGLCFSRSNARRVGDSQLYTNLVNEDH